MNHRKTNSGIFLPGPNLPDCAPLPDGRPKALNAIDRMELERPAPPKRKTDDEENWHPP